MRQRTDEQKIETQFNFKTFLVSYDSDKVAIFDLLKRGMKSFQGNGAHKFESFSMIDDYSKLFVWIARGWERWQFSIRNDPIKFTDVQHDDKY